MMLIYVGEILNLLKVIVRRFVCVVGFYPTLSLAPFYSVLIPSAKSS